MSQLIRMSRYYFDMREGARFVPDEVGLNLDAAERAAAETAAEIGRELLPKGDGFTGNPSGQPGTAAPAPALVRQSSANCA
jgi:hypothetical protein